jgi:diguanylate cyclase (GGDEF)-like protein
MAGNEGGLLRDRVVLVTTVSLLRWGAVGLALLQAFLVPHQTPLDQPDVFFAATFLMAAYNVPATFAGRLPPIMLEPLARLALIGDFIVISAWIFGLAGDPYSSSFALYTLVGMEAGLLLGWRGMVVFFVAFTVAYSYFYQFDNVLSKRPFEIYRYLFRVSLVLLVSATSWALATQNRRQRTALEQATTEARAAAESAEREARRARALYRVTARVAGMRRREDALETILDALTWLWPSRWHAFLLRNAAGGLDVAHVRGTPSDVKIELPPNPQGADVEGPMVFPNLKRDPVLRAAGMKIPPALRPYKSGVSIRLRGSRHDFGYLVALDKAEAAFDDDEVRFVDSLGSEATTALENARLYEELEVLSLTDSTTGLFNRRAFDNRLAEEFHRAERYGLNLALLMLDIDRFKHYNDTQGHVAGDQVLRQLGGILTGGTLRQVDLPFRYGGEEFVVIMPLTNATEGLALAERICEGVAAAHFAHGEQQPLGRLTISGGVAAYPEHCKNAKELVERADIALYAAKRSGRNQAMMWAPKLRILGARRPARRAKAKIVRLA